MSKSVFWPLVIVFSGVVILASHMGFIPLDLVHFWPLVLITVGLGGLFLSDREEWLSHESSTPARKSATKKTTTKKTPAKRKTAAKKATKKAPAKKTAAKKTTKRKTSRKK